MYHSVTFGDKNTWDDWHLIPTTRPVVLPPSIRTKYVEIPGMDGNIDITEVLTGRPSYNNRSGTMEFVTDVDFKQWHKLYSQIMNYLHGRRMRMILEDDPGYYYEGRFAVTQWKSDKIWSTITISYDVGPWKRSTTSTAEPWHWDPFDFEDGVVFDYSAIEVPEGNPVVISLTGGEHNTLPIFTATMKTKLTFRENTYILEANTPTSFDEIKPENEQEIETTANNLELSIDDYLEPKAAATDPDRKGIVTIDYVTGGF